MKRLIFGLLLLSGPSSLLAQEKFMAVVVDSASFNPMPYVSVFVKGKNRGTVTDTKGNFIIEATRSDTLVFTFVGYKPVKYPLVLWEPGLIRMTEMETVLKNVTVQSKAINPYDGVFDDQNAIIAARKNKFYFSKDKKEKRKVAWLKQDNQQAKTYIEVVIESPELKNRLMKDYKLTEEQYYVVLADFNAKNAHVMYYLTAGELITLINNFFKVRVKQQ